MHPHSRTHGNNASSQYITISEFLVYQQTLENKNIIIKVKLNKQMLHCILYPALLLSILQSFLSAFVATPTLSFIRLSGRGIQTDTEPCSCLLFSESLHFILLKELNIASASALTLHSSYFLVVKTISTE